MTRVAMSTQLNVPATQVWDIIGSFHGINDWLPGIEKSELEGGGTQRRLTLAGGAQVLEELEQHSDDEHTYTYRIVDSPLPLSGYAATIKVHDNGDGTSRVDWSSDFAPIGPEGDAKQIIEDVYNAGFENLQKMVAAFTPKG